MLCLKLKILPSIGSLGTAISKLMRTQTPWRRKDQALRKPVSFYSANTHVHNSTRISAHHQLPLTTSGKEWKDSIRSVADSPRRAAVTELRLITGCDCLASHLHRIGIKASPLRTLCKEDQVMDKRYLMLCPSLTEGTLSARYWDIYRLMTNF